MGKMLKGALFIAAIGLASAGWAQAPGSADTAKKGGAAKQAPASEAKVSSGEAGFLRKAAEHGTAEVELGRLAQERGLRDQVKSFGARMVADHEKANQELAKLAAEKSVALPEAPAKGHQRDLEKLRQHQGPDFDREYMKRMVADHKKDLKEFEKQAKSARDAQVKDFAARQVPILRDHLRAAQATYDVTLSSKRTGERETGSKKP